MKNKIISILIISLMLTQTNFAVIVSGDEYYNQKMNEEFVLKDDAYEYFNKLQEWLDRGSNVELLRKVASHSELRGYVSENEIDWEHLYDDQDTKATRSIAYLTFRAIEPSNVSYSIIGSESLDKDIRVSYDGISWSEWDGSLIQLQTNKTIKVYNTKTTLSNQTSRLKFNITGKVEASGKVNALINFSEPPPYCFSSLFEGCTGLVLAPDMPSIKMTQSCYSNMYNGCTNLEGTPYLPAQKLDTYCYSFMFSGCSKLSSIKIGYEVDFGSAFNQWVYGVNSTGTLYYKGTDDKTGASGIPTGWTVVKS